MTKDLTFHINNKAYTISGDEELERELCKYLDTDKNNDTKSLLLAYLKLNQEYRTFRKEVEDIANKIAGF
ncbi:MULTISPECIES: hypothetical protein [Aliarcobacter]|jgi:hypothetical protein|uniref:Uncharacterized protein n=6 Tax=Arcobacteraceae TaxID=2808963 RepID=A0A1V9VC02_9BACT|nr:hypothetical protein [Aliarcobacter cryaerophilus]MBK6302620.1 hypothetical protein [Arcobacter sp.]NCB13121.1 hypothetical protein [Erysipelotrichia bacterium]OQA74767.1 MAG: hypothetical protein BWY33_01321 [Candidatus Dependentiae bacterium ADurb.Bin246]WNL28227.1 hypothetical protein RMQ65_02385 [Arcobacter sp. AZ-2023]WPD04618.1 hypothetical protein QUR76_05710 [Arcobacter sp. DSM 115956]WPD06713.1 hypothetical protein QUR78_05710 [Arcobacter sp. DSM 115955]WPD11705.1 hypothetical pr